MQRKHKSDFHTPHNIFPSRHRTSWLWIRGRRGASVLIFLSQLSLSELLCPDLAQVDSSVLQHCTGVLCTVPPPLLAASWPLTETVTLSTGLHWPGLTLTLTLRQQHGAIIWVWETPANFQIKSHSWWSKYLHSGLSLHPAAGTPCLPNISRESSVTQLANPELNWYWQPLLANHHNETSIALH